MGIPELELLHAKWRGHCAVKGDIKDDVEKPDIPLPVGIIGVIEFLPEPQRIPRVPTAPKIRSTLISFNTLSGSHAE